MANNSDQNIKVDDFGELHREMQVAEDRLATAIGKFSVRFALVEKHANWAINVFLKLEPLRVGALVNAGIRSFSARLDILQSLANGMQMTNETREEIKASISSIRDLNVYRNWLLHDAWGPWNQSDDTWQKMRARTDKKFHYQHETFSTDEINRRADECWETIVSVSKSMKKYSLGRNERESSQEIS